MTSSDQNSNWTQPNGEFLLYETEDGRTRVECRFIDETLWLTQSGMTELYQTTKQNAGSRYFCERFFRASC